MELSVIITNYKTPDLLKLCLESIPKAIGSLNYEIFVIDSEADEETGEMIRELFPRVVYTAFKANTGFPKLVNAGLRQSAGDFTMILNGDMVLTENSLEKMVDYLRQHQAVGVLAPQLLNFDGSIQLSCFRFLNFLTIPARRTFFGKTAAGKKEVDRFLMKDFNHQSVREIDWAMGTALMVSKAALTKVGLMDEKFFMFLEDTDWCRRFHEAGFKVVYFPEAKMYHYHGRVSKKSGGLLDLFINKYAWIHLVSAFKYFWKYR